jgi:hypothetical protein
MAVAFAMFDESHISPLPTHRKVKLDGKVAEMVE